MFTFRLKHEFQDHKLTSLIWLGTLLLLILTTYVTWNKPLEFDDYRNDASFGFLFLGLLVACIVHVHQVLGRDLYLKHTAFWNTRPIRGGTLFKVKWSYLQLSITLPIMITAALLAIIIRRPDQALRGLLEYGCISLMVTSAFTYSMLAIRAGRYLALFLFGAVLFLPIILMANFLPRLLDEPQHFSNQINRTPILILIILTLSFIILFLFTLRKRHHAPSIVFIPILALVTLALLIFQPLRWSGDRMTLTSTQSTDKNPTDQKVYWNGTTQGNQDRLTFRQSFPLESSEWDASQRSYLSNVDLRLLNIPESLAERIVITAENPQYGYDPHIQINCSFCSKTPTGGTRSSSSRSLEKSHPVYSLPADTPVTISGSIIVTQSRYEEMINSPIKSEEDQSSGPLRFRVGKKSPLSGKGVELRLQYGNLASIVTENQRRFPEVEVNIFHQPTGIDFQRDGGYSSGGPLGISRQNTYSLRDNRRTREVGIDLEQIAEQSVVKITKLTEQFFYEVPIEFKTHIPDPAKVLELLD